jgi:hypothetical protein
MALFGIGATPTRRGATPLGPQVRLPNDGLWIKAGRPRNTQIGGVLFTQRVSPGNLGSATATLYQNPWATRSYTGALTQLPTAIFSVDGSEYETRAGRSLQLVLNIEAGWPYWPTEIEEDKEAEEFPTRT